MSNSNPTNKKLYNEIKEKIKNDLDSKGKRWSAYASGRLVQEYKRRGGKYSGKKNDSVGLSRWYKEKWIDVCHWPKKVSCGRKKFSPKKFPYCRPSVKITNKTPKTVQSLTQKERKKRCSTKRKKYNFCGEPSNQKYVITQYTKDKAKKLGFTIKPSNKKTKKIDVYKNKKFIASVGGKGCKDYPTYLKLEKQGKVVKGTANKKRINYKKRHQNDRLNKFTKDGKYSRGWLADQLLW